MAEAYIVGAVRTPIGTRKGALAAVHPADLGAHVLKELVNRTGIDPAAVEDVIMGCVTQVGPQALDLARTAWLSAGLPESTPGVTIDRQCGSSQQAVHFAAQGVMSGTQDLVIAAGVENMGMVPMGANVQFAVDNGLSVYGQGWVERYGTQEISQFRGAQLMCEKWGYTREDLEKYALESHRRAAAAIEAGYFDAETAPLAGVTHDEGVRPDTSLEKMAELAPLREGWALTAAVSSQISVGASALLIASERAVAEHGLTPLARIVQLALAGDDPVYMLTAPIPATRIALRKAGLDIDDIDVVEINEAFAPVVLSWAHDVGADLAKTNVNGGAIAIGHPLGASGARIMTTLVNALEQ
ncbi:MAG: acetyl-CoA C-acyltransferase, partial [Thermobifida fusca]|nr:acetyl-CoA C-acyltransferase [Thermobifida fusca]